MTGAVAASTLPMLPHTSLGGPAQYRLNNNIRHSVCRWTYGHLSLDELCLLVKKIGFTAIDLVGPGEWGVLKKHGVDSSMCNGAEISLTEGWNDPGYHDQLTENYSKMIPLVAHAGYKNLICFSGNRKGMDDETGLKNCIHGLKRVMPLAEKNNVILQMELFNSKIDHPDYMCDKSAWGIELCKQLGSENFKLLYDIYHMQINEGDIIRTIKENHQFFGHYHTAGVPGRHEIDDSQELYYPAIMKTIEETGFKGYVAQEFIPTKENKEAALAEAIKICDI
ncbi:Hydroxypyruvate isomerase [Fulvivirga imtechensis AK7]|uniref:Hydroxypyruvate isomerase n=1 Tax=Fulvivirga imtechensis AK7 TaxID=1237149 RepID=L8JMD5_9BACT|nr:Hydroxypyruvate isomerase [Fulvivirga imtechensis AK7]